MGKYVKLGKITAKSLDLGTYYPNPEDVWKQLYNPIYTKELSEDPVPKELFIGQTTHIERERYLTNSKNTLGNVPTFEIEIKDPGKLSLGGDPSSNFYNMEINGKDAIKILDTIEEHLLKFGNEYANTGCYEIVLKSKKLDRQRYGTNFKAEDCVKFRKNLINALGEQYVEISQNDGTKLNKWLRRTAKLIAGGAAGLALFGTYEAIGLLFGEPLSPFQLFLSTTPYILVGSYGVARNLDRKNQRVQKLLDNYIRYDVFRNVQVISEPPLPRPVARSTAPSVRVVASGEEPQVQG